MWVKFALENVIIQAENERFDAKIKEFRQKLTNLAQKKNEIENQRLQDSERIEASERVLIEERGVF